MLRGRILTYCQVIGHKVDYALQIPAPSQKLAVKMFSVDIFCRIHWTPPPQFLGIHTAAKALKVREADSAKNRSTNQPLKQVLSLPGFSMRTTCSAVQCNHVTVDRNNINLALILIFTSTAIVQSVIGRWREKVVGRRRRFVHPLRHFWRRFCRTCCGCTGRRSCRTLGATTFRAADNQEESDQATE